MIKRTLSIALALTVASATVGFAGDAVLSSTGDLYRLRHTTFGLVLSITPVDGETASTLIPQTSSCVTNSLNVGIDESTDAVIAAWQQGATDSAELRLAVYIDGTWLGPVVLDGGPDGPALYPELLVHRAVSSVLDEDGEPVEIATTFAHLAWWRTGQDGHSGEALYAALRLGPGGLPEFTGFEPFPLRNLVPWGIGCYGVDAVSDLVHPKLFIDPETGDPHVMATDFGSCLVQIVQLQAVVDTDVEIGKRGRHVVLFGRTAVIGVNPDIDMAKANIEAGHDLSVVLYWDVDGGIEYATMRESGWSEVKTLAVGENLSYLKAVDLVRALAR